MEEQIKQQQNIALTFSNGDVTIFTDVQGYQIGGGVLALSLEDGTQEIYNMSNVFKIVKTISISKE